MAFDDYVIQGELGHGASGTVFRACPKTGGQPVAIKIVKLPVLSGPGLSPSPDPGITPEQHARIRRKEISMRFAREQRLTASFGQDQGFVACIEHGETPTRDLYIVMPFVSGGTLRQRLQNEGRLAVEEAIQIIQRLSAAMGAAHSRGVVHRDLKPENILFTQSGVPLVADLGLAKHFDRDATGASSSLGVSGTAICAELMATCRSSR